jgi:hypothetical protein
MTITYDFVGMITPLEPIPIDVDGTQMHYLHPVPSNFVHYMLNGSPLLIRPSYVRLYEQLNVVLREAAERPKSLPPKILLRGSPDVGKTAFLFYVIWRILHDSQLAKSTTHRPIVYRNCNVRRSFIILDGECYNAGKSLCDYAFYDAHPDALYLFDGGSFEFELPPGAVPVASIVVAAPEHHRYSDYDKDGNLMHWWLSPFSLTELTALWQILQLTPSVTPPLPASKAELKALMDEFGGIPYVVFGNDRIRTEYRNVLQSEERWKETLDDLFRFEHYGSYNRHTIIHCYASYDGDTGPFDPAKLHLYQLRFASEAQARRMVASIMKKSSTKGAGTVVDKFIYNVCGGSDSEYNPRLYLRAWLRDNLNGRCRDSSQ